MALAALIYSVLYQKDYWPIDLESSWLSYSTSCFLPNLGIYANTHNSLQIYQQIFLAIKIIQCTTPKISMSLASFRDIWLRSDSILCSKKDIPLFKTTYANNIVHLHFSKYLSAGHWHSLFHYLCSLLKYLIWYNASLLSS